MTNKYKIKGDDYMNIRLNGGLSIDDIELYFDDLEIEIKEDVEEGIEFDVDKCDINNYIESCEDCGFCDCEDDEYDVEESLDELIDDYTEVLLELGDCPDCVRNILAGLISEILD